MFFQLFRNIFRCVRTFSNVFERFQTCSDPFGPVRTCADLLGRNKNTKHMHSNERFVCNIFAILVDVFKRFRMFVQSVGTFFNVFRLVRTCVDLFGLVQTLFLFFPFIFVTGGSVGIA